MSATAQTSKERFLSHRPRFSNQAGNELQMTSVLQGRRLNMARC